MTEPDTAAVPGWRTWATAPAVLWSAFVLVHFWLGYLNLFGPGEPLGDVEFVYRFWSDQAIVAHYWQGIDSNWVYPIVAILPMLAAHVFGSAEYSPTWLTMVMILDAGAFWAIIGWGKRRQNSGIAWWWLLFLLLLGPISLGRLDSITVPFGIVGVLLVATRPRTASFLLTIATWIKVWPAAIIAAMVIALRSRAKIIITAAWTSVFIIAVALAFGAGLNVFGFITQQSGRGLQVEAPVSTIWLWRQFSGIGDSNIYYDTTLLTWQLQGPGVTTVASIMTPILVIVLVAVAILGILAMRNRAPATDVLPALGLAFITAFIAFNKVGSPQYITWLAVPVILGLATTVAGHGKSFRVPATITIVLAALTQIIYPYLYGYLLSVNVLMLFVITAKDILLFVLLGWAIASLIGSARRHEVDDGSIERTEWLPVVWPFLPRAESVDETEEA